MALSTQSAVKAKRRAFNAVNTFAFRSSLSQLLSALFQELSQKYANPDLQVVELVDTGTTDIVVADAPCKLYALFLKGGSAGGDFRAADHASSANTPTTTIPVAAADPGFGFVYPAGKAYANGITVDASGSSGVNWSGFAIIGAA